MTRAMLMTASQIEGELFLSESIVRLRGSFLPETSICTHTPARIGTAIGVEEAPPRDRRKLNNSS